ncbi:MAG: sodium-dependent transporter [Chlamydiales bacterium]|nr:sodium-dependent transporter [Chlamydiales bacterium]
MREHWSSKLGFIFAAIGSAIGLGALWKFPYTVGQNGGGLFLITYVLCIIVIGIPVFIAELMLGRASQRSSVGAFAILSNNSSFWKIGGWLGVLSSFLIMSFYSVIAGYGMSYVLMSLNGFYIGLTEQQVSSVYMDLFTSGDISILWHLLFTLITMSIVLSGVRKGIEFWSKLMTRALFVILIGLFVYSTTLNGFKEAAHFIFYPDFANFKFSSALEALGLAFFTLSLGQGIMISYGSYMRDKESISYMAVIVGFAVIAVAILAALCVFPVVFTFDFAPSAGPGLIFQTVPFLFAQLPGSIIISTIFFILFVFTALTSAIAFIEVVAANLMELFHLSRKRAVYFTSLCTFVFGIPSALAGAGWIFPEWSSIYKVNFLETIDQLVSVWVIPIGGLFTAIFVGWVMDKNIAYKQFIQQARFPKFYHLWMLVIRYLIPVLIVLIIMQNSGMINFDQIFKKA